MSKAGGWVPIDKGAIKTLGNINRPYSTVEALYSYTVDMDNGKKYTYRGYAKLWQWSVGKVKRFVEGLMNTSGTEAERKGNGSGTVIHFIDKGLWVLDEQLVNSSGTVDEHKRLPTINPLILKPKKEKEKPFSPRVFLLERKVNKQHVTDFLKNRKTKRLTNTLTAFSTILNEAEKAKLSLPDAIEKCAREGWGGFKASWLDNVNNGPGGNTKQPVRINNAEDTRKMLEEIKNGSNA